MEPDVSTLTDALERTAKAAPSRGITIFDSRGRNPLRRTYPDVLANAKKMAKCWKAAGVSRGDRVLIVLPTSWNWVDSWLGAMLSRAIPVAASPGGGLGSGTSDFDRIERLVHRVEPRFVLVSQSFREESIAAGHGTGSHRQITFHELSTFRSVAPIADEDDPSSIAFFQLTSGTERFPRAVQISHRAAQHNVQALSEAILAPLETQRIETIVSWLPLYHDMGLVGAFLQAITTRRELVLLPPRAFLGRPLRWLEEIGRQKSTLSLSPAFGFQYCIERLGPGSVGDLNLESWSAAICGAETIPPRTAAEFASAFGGTGFRGHSFRAGYGLAEATVVVTLDRKGRGARTMFVPDESRSDRQPREVVCLGEPVADTEIRCVGPNGVEHPEGQTGEILVHGPGLCSGYFGEAQATGETFQDGWLRTGDLGFIRSGELYLTGRLKDVLIIRGQNLMPQQLEWIAEEICGGRARAAAFSLETSQSGELAVLLVETAEQVRERIASAAAEIRSRIGDAFGLQLADLVFLRRGRLPTSTSGKLQRSVAKELYLAGRLQGSMTEEMKK